MTDKLKKIDLVTDDLHLGDRDERADLISNFKMIQDSSNKIIDCLSDLDNDHKKILKKLDEIEKLEQQNAKNVAQNHKNIEQQVAILHDYFDVPIVWDGDDLILEKEE